MKQCPRYLTCSVFIRCISISKETKCPEHGLGNGKNVLSVTSELYFLCIEMNIKLGYWCHSLIKRLEATELSL